jgi:hypothetical protein
MLICCVVVRVLILTKYNSLADKIECIGTAAETAVSCFKAVQTGEYSNSSIIRGSVIKYEVAELFRYCRIIGISWLPDDAQQPTRSYFGPTCARSCTL